MNSLRDVLQPLRYSGESKVPIDRIRRRAKRRQMQRRAAAGLAGCGIVAALLIGAATTLKPSDDQQVVTTVDVTPTVTASTEAPPRTTSSAAPPPERRVEQPVSLPFAAVADEECATSPLDPGNPSDPRLALRGCIAADGLRLFFWGAAAEIEVVMQQFDGTDWQTRVHTVGCALTPAELLELGFPEIVASEWTFPQTAGC